MELREPRHGGPFRPAAAAGSLWGLGAYGVLWEGTPVEVSRSFVASPVGTVLLLPARLVIWGILAVESLIGRTFDLSTSYAWIAPAAMIVGAGLGVAVQWIGRARRARSGGPRLDDETPA